MNNKKSLFFLNFLFLLPLASAAYSLPSWNDISTNLGTAMSTFLNQIFNVEGGVIDPVLFSKLLIFILIFAVIYFILQKQLDWDKNIVLVIAIIASILGIRVLPAEIINMIMLPYGAMTIVLTTFLPIVILFGFLELSGLKDNKWFFYGLWSLMIVSLLALALIRYPVIGPYIWIYIIAAAVVGIIVLVSSYRKATMYSSSVSESTMRAISSQRTKLLNELDNLMIRALNAGTHPAERKILRRDIAEIIRMLRHLKVNIPAHVKHDLDLVNSMTR
jgi:hypothetical protein